MDKESSGPVTRQAATRGSQNQPSAPPSSAPKRKAETVSEHPLGEPGNDESSNKTKEVTRILET